MSTHKIPFRPTNESRRAVILTKLEINHRCALVAALRAQRYRKKVASMMEIAVSYEARMQRASQHSALALMVAIATPGVPSEDNNNRSEVGAPAHG